MKETYMVVMDQDELDKFIGWLPDTKKGETYYFSLLARNKYMRDLGIGTMKSDKHQCARWVAGKDRMLLKLLQTESPIGSYAVKGLEVPQEALAAYVTVNPRSHVKAAKLALKRLADVVADGEDNPNVYQESLTALHKAMSRKVFVDIDFDGVVLGHTLARLRGKINPGCLSVVTTRGGFHLLVELGKVDGQYVETWYRDVASLPGADIIGDNMLPIPGTYQGGYIPRLLTNISQVVEDCYTSYKSLLGLT